MHLSRTLGSAHEYRTLNSHFLRYALARIGDAYLWNLFRMEQRRPRNQFDDAIRYSHWIRFVDDGPLPHCFVYPLEPEKKL